jgi:hypothetical protein
MKRLATLLGTLALSLSASSATTYGLHLGSVHMPKGTMNNFNPGIYVKLDNGFTAGAYHNSFRRVSAYGGYTWHLLDVGSFSADVTAGGVTGYQGKQSRGFLAPLVLPSVAYGDATKVRVGYLPAIDPKRGVHVLHFMVERSF